MQSSGLEAAGNFSVIYANTEQSQASAFPVFYSDLFMSNNGKGNI